ncbi:MAG: 4-hydroxythreonine-4-phosphate dehydrogenase PdxA [Gammaproteobacteria bacterium]
MGAKPKIAIPVGDPAGIGPEIVVKALNEPTLYEICRPLVIGDYGVVEMALRTSGLDARVAQTTSPEEGRYQIGTLDLYAVHSADVGTMAMGKPQAACGKAAFAYIERAVALAVARQVDAIATAPINKESLKAAGVPYIGHTEMLAELTATADPLTLFEVRGLRVFFLTRHVALRDACELITRDRVLDYILRGTTALKRLGVTEGTMAVAGVNPHAGEHGLFGREECDHIEPAVREAQSIGIDVVGPIPADSVFHFALEGRYTSVLSMYHDQGHVACKTLDFERTIAITNGLPFLRTSVDHGTAFDIAGQGVASPVSMVEAIRLAAKYAPYFTGAADVGDLGQGSPAGSLHR